MSEARPAIEVAVIMRRERLHGAAARWQTWRWALADVVPHEPGFGAAPRCLFQDENEARWLYPAQCVELFRDDAEGYWLNGTTPAPCWFVLWRLQDQAPGAEALTPGGGAGQGAAAGAEAAADWAVPAAVSLSYHDAGRWLDAQETVEQVPAPPEVVAWMMDFARTHQIVEPKRRQRPQSFQPLTDRFGNPAKVSTGWQRRGGADAANGVDGSARGGSADPDGAPASGAATNGARRG